MIMGQIHMVMGQIHSSSFILYREGTSHRGGSRGGGGGVLGVLGVWTSGSSPRTLFFGNSNLHKEENNEHVSALNSYTDPHLFLNSCNHP